MELEKIRNLSDDELQHHEKTSAEQLFRLRFQVSLGQNDGVKKLRQLRKEIAQVKTVARERELGVRGAKKELVATPAAKPATAKPATAKPTAAKTVRAKSATPKSATAKSATAKTASAKKGAGK
jgi:large subunit ribosomal protein L29